MLKQHSYELAHLNEPMPTQVAELAQEYGGAAKRSRFRARNWRREVTAGFAFDTPKGILVVQEECRLWEKGQEVPAYGVMLVSENDLGKAIEGLFCHAVVQVSFYGHNVRRR